MKSTGMIKTNRNDNKFYRSLSCLCLTLLLLAALTASFVAPLWAANEGDNIPISIVDGATAPDTAILLGDDQQNPFVIAVPDKNKWFVVWEDWRNWATSGADIYGRFINVDGSYCGDEILISDANGNQTVPTLAYRNLPDSNPQVVGTDKILIAWQDTRNSVNYVAYKIIDISLMTSDCSSASLGAEQNVNYTSIGSDSLQSRKLPDAAYDSVRDQFWLVWVEGRNVLQRIEERPFGVASGTTSWSFGDTNYVGYGTIDASSGTVTSSDVIRNQGAYTRTVRLISYGLSSSEEVFIYEYFRDVNNVKVSCDQSSPEALIVWEGVRGRATLTCTYKNLTGSPDGPDPTDSFFSELKTDNWDGDDGKVHIFSIFEKNILQAVVHSLLIDSSSIGSYYPVVNFDNSHRKFLVAWEDRDARNGVGDGIHSNIFGQLVYSGGGLYGNNIPISFQDTNGDGTQDATVLNSNQTRPQISIDTTNQRFFVVWQDGRNTQVSLENLDIYGQFVDSEGSLRGSNYAVCVEPANQYNPVTAFNAGNHQFLSVWKDARNLATTDSDIYGQRFTLGQPQLILLQENGDQLIPPFINFPALEVSQSSLVTLTMKNIGDSVIKIDSVTSLSAPFSYVNLPNELETDDGDTIDLIPGASYPLTVKFEPTAEGVFIADFTVKSDSTSLKVNLQGQALKEPPTVDTDIEPDPKSYNFGEVNLEDTAFFILTLTNNGNADVKITSTEIPSGFAAIGLDGAIIGAGKKIFPIIKFNPKQSRPYTGSMFVAYSAEAAYGGSTGGGAFQISLEGVGKGNIIASIKPPGNTSFGNVAVGDSRSANLAFENNGNVDVVITAVDLPGNSGFTVSGIPATITAGTTLVAVATFNPDLPRTYSAPLRILYDHGITTTQLTLSGAGVYDVNHSVEVESQVEFGQVNIGETRSSTLRFFNQGSVDVNITAVDLPEWVFVVSGIPGRIPAHGVLDALLVFTPLLEQNYDVTMRILYDQGVVSSEIRLQGSGVDISAPAVAVAPQSFFFGQAALGTTKTETFVVTNTGNVDLEIVGVDLPGALFKVTGIGSGMLAAGMSTVGIVTFTPVAAGDFSGVLRLLFNHDLAPQEIMMQGSAVDIDVSPLVLEFPNSDIDSNTVLSVTITNSSDADIQVKGAVTGTDSYSVSGIAAGDIIRSSGGSLTCQVTFKPTAPGYLEDGLYFNVGQVQDMDNIPFEEIDWGTQYVVTLKGLANADFVVSDFDTFTADIDYKVSVSASTAAAGQLFVLFSHDPLSSGKIYALTSNGKLKLFPYEASFGWQNLWYKAGAAPGMKLDLSQVDFRELGCTQCQGEKVDAGDNDFYFGNIIITPPDDSVFNNASDFKYMPGTLYMGTYVKNAAVSGAFDFNKGLLEMQSLHINSLAGTWQVTSEYNGTDRVHSTHLVVTEDGDGNISAVWPEYNRYNVSLVYGSEKSGYVMTFNIGVYQYTYKINSLTADEFTGTYTCIANGEVLEDAPVSGVRLQ